MRFLHADYIPQLLLHNFTAPAGGWEPATDCNKNRGARTFCFSGNKEARTASTSAPNLLSTFSYSRTRGEAPAVKVLSLAPSPKGHLCNPLLSPLYNHPQSGCWQISRGRTSEWKQWCESQSDNRPLVPGFIS